MIQLLVCGPLDRGANQDKGLNRDVKVILEEFSLDLAARKQVELNSAK